MESPRWTQPDSQTPAILDGQVAFPSALLRDTVTVALAGQPNVGKSTVFNLLTGLSQHTGHWPGGGLEQKAGTCRHNGMPLHVVDLPSVHSLTANSLEERIARDYILAGHPDVVVVIADAAALETSLYLLAELLWLPVPVVLGLNMLDAAGRQGLHLEPHVLEAALGLPVVPMVAARNQGVHELVEAVQEVACQTETYTPHRPEISPDHRRVLAEIQGLIAGRVPPPYPEDWVALKLLEGDAAITPMMQARLADRWEAVHALLRQHEDAILAVASGRYAWIGRMVRAAVTHPKAGQVTLTDRLDRVATHPIGGLLILVGIVGLLFWATYAIGTPLQQWLDLHLVQAGAGWVRAALHNAPPWLSGLLADGVIGGAGTVVTLLPILVIFFALLGVLEDSGYLARAAYVMDRFMHMMGLHGNSFLPLFMGFSCNVPAVMGSRIIDSPKARLLTIMVTPLVPCAARLTVLAVLAPFFFGSYAMWVSLGLVGLSLALLVVIGVALHELVLGGEHVAFIIELPLYHLPNPRSIALSAWQKIADFLKEAGGVILIVSVGVWALSTLPGGGIEASYLAAIGRSLAPVGALMGLNWQMMVALLTSFVRKENTIATLAVLYGAGQAGISLGAALQAALTPAAALAFLTLQVLFIPCVATVATIRQETGSWRWTAVSVVLLLILSFAMGIVAYQVAGLWF
jgi:ferrous iron transport protein B